MAYIAFISSPHTHGCQEGEDGGVERLNRGPYNVVTGGGGAVERLNRGPPQCCGGRMCMGHPQCGGGWS